MKILGLLNLTLYISFVAAQSSHGVGQKVLENEDTDATVLLKIAREYRQGKNNAPLNLDKAVHFYQYSLEQGGDSDGSISWELYELLDEQSKAQSTPNIGADTLKFKQWDLLESSAAAGLSNAQHELSTALATGITSEGKLVESDPARALILEYASSLAGSSLANMGMGYRLLKGIGTSQSCEKALPHYELTANTAAQWLQMLPLAPSPPAMDKIRLSDISSQLSRSSGGGRALRPEGSDELTDYYIHLAEGGDAASANILGTMYANGNQNTPSDLQRAAYFLRMASQQRHPAASGLLGYILVRLWYREHMALADNKVDNEAKDTDFVQNDDSLSLHGRDNWRVSAEFSRAAGEDYGSPAKFVELLRFAARRGDANGLVGLGFAHAYGVGSDRNATRALEYLNRALTAHPDAGFIAGEIHMRSLGTQQKKGGGTSVNSNNEIGMALQAYSMSSSLGNPLAQHRLGQVAARGMSGSRSCDSAVGNFKAVAEKGPWVLQGLAEAYKLYNRGKFAQALGVFSKLAAIGVEIAQFNAAHLLSQTHCDSLSVSEPVTSDRSSEDKKAEKMAACETRALALLGLSAAQGNSEALVLVGDFYYYGLAKLQASRSSAAGFYQRAADLHNTKATFNLGLMHEVGDGVSQDFHLAKRFYDLAAEMDTRAATARDLVLLVMQGHKSVLALLGPQGLTQFQGAQAALDSLESSAKYIVRCLQQVDSWAKRSLDSVGGAGDSFSGISSVLASSLLLPVLRALNSAARLIEGPAPIYEVVNDEEDFLSLVVSFLMYPVTVFELVFIACLALLLFILLLLKRFRQQPRR